MATTIQVKETTKQLLDTVKRRSKASSYDAVLLKLLKKPYEVSDMFGITRKKPIKFSRSDEMQFNEL